MAIYKGREVQVLGRSDGADVSPMYDILDQWNQRSSVKLNELHFTENEVKDIKDRANKHFDNVNVIKDKELQDLRDSQDKEKIEQKQGKSTPDPVEVKQVYVNPSEVQDKSKITPQMKVQAKK